MARILTTTDIWLLEVVRFHPEGGYMRIGDLPPRSSQLA
jgi:hypothetical protein